MTRPEPMSRPSDESVAQRLVQVLVRDYPEVLEILESFGVDAGGSACATAGELDKDNPGLIEAISAALAWRPVGAPDSASATGGPGPE
jgi:hypothetical protein